MDHKQDIKDNHRTRANIKIKIGGEEGRSAGHSPVPEIRGLFAHCSTNSHNFSLVLENSHTHLNFPFEVGSSKRPQRSSVRKPVEVWKDEGCVDNSVVDQF